MNGEKPQIPALGYTWKTLPNLNREIWKKYKKMIMEEAKEMMETLFTSVQKLIELHSEEEFFTKKK